MTDASSHSMQHSADPPEPDPDFIKWLKEHCVPICGMVLGALVLCLVTRYSSTTVDWTRTKEFTEAVANVSVSSMFVLIEGSVFLIVTMQFKNVGLSRIAFDREASSLVIFEYVASDAGEILGVESNRSASFWVFADKDKYIEPNEIVERQRLIALPRIPNIGYQLEVEIGTDSGYRWRATAIVDKSSSEDNDVG